MRAPAVRRRYIYGEENALYRRTRPQHNNHDNNVTCAHAWPQVRQVNKVTAHMTQIANANATRMHNSCTATGR